MTMDDRSIDRFEQLALTAGTDCSLPHPPAQKVGLAKTGPTGPLATALLLVEKMACHLPRNYSDTQFRIHSLLIAGRQNGRYLLKQLKLPLHKNEREHPTTSMCTTYLIWRSAIVLHFKTALPRCGTSMVQ